VNEPAAGAEPLPRQRDFGLRQLVARRQRVVLDRRACRLQQRHELRRLGRRDDGIVGPGQEQIDRECHAGSVFSKFEHWRQLRASFARRRALV
jgi:hypothetical protein